MAPLLGLSAALLLGLAAQLFLPSASETPIRSASPVALTPARLSALPTDHPAILARPLFSPSRGDLVAGSTSVASFSDYTLAGVARIGARSIAFLRAPNGAERSVGVGDTGVGWRIVRIGPDDIEIETPGARRVVNVSSASGAKGTPP